MLPLARLLLAAIFLLVLSTPRSGYAAETSAIFDLWINGVDKGEVAVALRRDDVLVGREALEHAGLVGVGGRTETVLGKPAVSLASLAPAVSYRVDEGALALRIVVPVRMLRTTIVSLAPTAPPDLEHRQDTSAFLNYGVRGAYPLSVTTLFDGGLSFQGNLLESTLTVSSAGGAVRGLSNFTMDDRAGLRRWVAGDAFVNMGALGGGTYLGGLSVSKTFAIDPYFIQTPALGTSGATATPALLDVYVNGVLVKSVLIPPGPFQVERVVAPTGSGNLRYVVRDLLGTQQSVTTPFYASATALARGLSEYSYAFGARRLNLGAQSFSYGAAGLLGRHRYGFTDHVTAGARLEAAMGLVSGGPSLTLALPFGQVDLEAAGSVTPDHLGFAGLAAYSFTSRRLGLALSVRGASDGYSTLSLAPTDDRERLRVSGSTSVALGSKATIGAQYSLVLDRDLGTTFRVGTTSNVQLTRRISLVLGLGRSSLPNKNTAVDASAGLSITIDANLSFMGGGRLDTSNGTHELYADLNRPLPAGTGYGYRAYAVASETPSILATGQYQGPYGRYQATVQESRLAGPSASVEAAGAVVWVSGAGVAAARPIQDGFAMIRIPEVAGVRGFLNNQELGRTDRRGLMVLPTLLPYYANRVSVADTDLPLDRTISAVERTIAPPYRGGALIEFSAKPARFFRGRVIVEVGGREVVPAYGEITVLAPSGEVTSPLGKQGELELSDLAPGEYPARVMYGRGVCNFNLRLPSSTQIVADLGTLRCAQSK